MAFRPVSSVTPVPPGGTTPPTTIRPAEAGPDPSVHSALMRLPPAAVASRSLQRPEDQEAVTRSGQLSRHTLVDAQS